MQTIIREGPRTICHEVVKEKAQLSSSVGGAQGLTVSCETPIAGRLAKTQ